MQSFCQETGLFLKKNTYEKLSVINKLSLNDIGVLKIQTSKGMFTGLSVNSYGSSNTVGEPKLPVLKRLIEIPVGAICKVNIINSSYVDVKMSTLGINFPVIPAQRSVSKSEDPSKVEFVVNNQVYKINNFLNHELAKVEPIGTMRGLTLGRLDIAPVYYNPAKKTLRIYTSIEIEIVFENADVSATISQKQKFYSPFFEASFNKILNYKEIPDKNNLTKYPVKYVIVSDPMFQNEMQNFVQWKTKKGFKVIEAYTNNASVGTTTTSIKAYLQNLYNSATANDPAPSFVLFVGDVAQVPAFTGTTGSHASDLYFCEYTSDFLPEVYYGRFSATNVAELRPQVNKTLEYEQYLMPKTTFLDTCVMIAGQDGTYGPEHGDAQIYYGTDNYFNITHGLYSHTYLYAVSGSSASQIRQNVSKGVCVANYTAHGSSSGWADPSFSVSDVASLNNNHKYPLMIGNCCQTNKFDDPVCFGEALLRADGKGALGYIGGSNNTYWDEDYFWGVGYRSFSNYPPQHATYSASNLGAYDRTFHSHGEPFGSWFQTQGQMVVAGNLAVQQSGNSSANYYWEIYHLMGDPSLMVYYSEPPAMTVTYNSLMPLGATSFQITTNAPYCYAAISMNGILHGAALADSLGNISVNLTPITVPGTADVVITCQNRQPYIGTVIVASPSGPYVLHVKNHINTPNDSLIDYNENVTLDVTLKNYGAVSANGVSATISSTDPYLNITDNNQNWGTINSQGTSTQNAAFAFTTSNFIPDQHIAHFQLSITDNSSNSWSSNLSYKINAPQLEIGNFVIDDQAGNNNGAIDAGENASINILSLNTGHSNAANTIGTLTTTSPYITILNGTFQFNTLNKGASVNAVFPVTVSSTLPDTAVIEFIYHLTSGAYDVYNYYYVSVGQAMEDFETNNFLKFDWQHGGNVPWTITSVAPYEGLYSAKSGDINDEQTSELSVTMDVSATDTISFWKKVSCEPGSNWGGSYSWYDFLEFSIDGASKDRWDGENPDWSKAQYVVTPGNHIFKWTYSKDVSVSSGQDCAWLDYIIFPPSIKVIATVEENTNNNLYLQCFPNPAKGFTRISFNLEASQNISLILYDLKGNAVDFIINKQRKGQGEHNVLVDMAKFTAGIYYLSLQTESSISNEKIILIK